MKNKLASIISPLSVEKFLKYYKSNTQIAVHDLKESISDLVDLPFLKSLEDLYDYWPKQVDSYKPGIADEVNSTTTSVTRARELFKEGRALLFNDADTTCPLLQEWSQSLKLELGLSNLTYARSLFYAVPEGSGTDPHFDQNINFVIQLHGTKKWWLAPNEHVVNPLTRHTIGTAMDPELTSYAATMPNSFPDNATEITLKPGSVLFVPRGVWHKTHAAQGDSLSLNFTFTAPTWIDILTAALRGRLAQSSEWRETADSVSDAENCHEALDKFDMLLAELAHEMPRWRASDILQATEMDHFPLE